MDAIVAAIAAVLPALASSLVTDATRDAYAGLKTLIRNKWGADDPLVVAVEEAEADPNSEKKIATLSNAAKETSYQIDEDILAAAEKLRRCVEQSKEGDGSVNIKISGGNVQGVVGAHHVTVHDLNIGAPPKT